MSRLCREGEVVVRRFGVSGKRLVVVAADVQNSSGGVVRLPRTTIHVLDRSQELSNFALSSVWLQIELWQVKLTDASRFA